MLWSNYFLSLLNFLVCEANSQNRFFSPRSESANKTNTFLYQCLSCASGWDGRGRRVKEGVGALCPNLVIPLKWIVPKLSTPLSNKRIKEFVSFGHFIFACGTRQMDVMDFFYHLLLDICALTSLLIVSGIDYFWNTYKIEPSYLLKKKTFRCIVTIE